MSTFVEILKAALLGVLVFTFLAIVGAMYGVYFERKISGWIQVRYGPKHVGPWGLLQTIADTLKLLQKEHITPRRADAMIFNTAPIIVAVAGLLDWVVIPFGTAFGRVLVVRDINIGIVYFSAMASLTVIGILAAGWSSNNKYALLGGLRSASQMISYEIPLALALLWAAMLAGTLSTVGIIEAQRGGWFLFKVPPFGLIAGLVFLIAATAEVNRMPFDLPEAESELVAGYFAEYTGMRFALFQLGEYAEMFAMAAVASILFLGGWLEPTMPQWVWALLGLGALALAAFIRFSALRQVLLVRPILALAVLGAVLCGLMVVGIGLGRTPVLPSMLWFFAKMFGLVFFLMWMRWTYPRLRLDQLLGLSWKVLLPVGLLNLLITGFLLTVAR
ncbi:MAG TPA: NADH-quinone oxidoreductase subunit NuoH [bacterium]|nr:NADH-quinone oxidoreductase subunit NuoH [bacterium]